MSRAGEFVCALAVFCLVGTLARSAGIDTKTTRSGSAADAHRWRSVLHAAAGESMVLPLDPGLSVTIVWEAGEVLPHGGTIRRGRLLEIPGGAVTLVARGTLACGAIHVGPRGAYAVEMDEERVVVRALNHGELAGRGCAHGGGPLDHAATTRSAAPRGRRGLDAASNCDDGTVIDVMVVYTQAARVAAGGVAQIENAIDLAIADANAAFTRSLIDTSLRLVHSQEVTYVESGLWQTDGPRLVNPGDGFLDEVHALRDQYGADCVSLWVNSLNTGGIGYFPDASLTGVGASGFSMLRLSNAPLLTFAHEIGHNLYCTHDRPNTADVPYAPYAYGFVEPGGAWQTIMAVSPTALVPYFANPDVNWPGPTPPNPGPTGIPDGQPNPCDVALTINETRHIVANFRPTAVPGLPAVLRVRADAPLSGDGTSWASALPDLGDALCAAAGSGGAVQEIWVKAGTYTPDRGTGDRASSFRLREGIAIYGGFAGTENVRAERDAMANVTVLSGDIGVAGDPGDNCYHVVEASLVDASAVLDGFTITAGRADGADPDDRGAGVLVAGGGSPTLRGCTITGNTAFARGGGIYNSYGASPTVTDCTIVGNSVTDSTWPAGGGGVYNEAGANPVLQDAAILNNTAARGAGMANLFDCVPALTGCAIAGNTVPAGGEGGGIYNYGGCSPALTGCTLENNQATYGGGMASFFDSIPTLTDCVVRGNTAYSDGGGLYNYSNASAELTRCVLADNSAAYGGAMSNLFASVATLANCTVTRNTASSDGGGLYNYADASVVLVSCLMAGNTAAYGAAVSNLFDSDASFVNCTVVGNAASNAGGGVYNYQSDPSLDNTILWQNRVGAVADEGAQIHNFNSTSSLANCTVSGWTGTLGGPGNNGSDPLFRDADGADNLFGTDDDNARPKAGSPAIDTGDSGAVPPDLTTDLDGRPRILGASVDRGAYEYTTPAPGDFDGDGDVNLVDYPALAACLAGPGVPPAPAAPITTQECRAVFDFDNDQDVDLSDAAAFLLAF